LALKTSVRWLCPTVWRWRLLQMHTPRSHQTVCTTIFSIRRRVTPRVIGPAWVWWRHHARWLMLWPRCFSCVRHSGWHEPPMLGKWMWCCRTSRANGGRLRRRIHWA